MSQSDIYTVICIIFGEKNPFEIKIEKNETVGLLKKLIKEENANLAGIDTKFLDLYHVDIAEDDSLVTNVKAHPLDSKLPVTASLIEIFPDTPEKHKVHFIVKPSKF